MIKVRDFTFDIKSDLTIKLEYRDRLIRRESVECIEKSKTNKDFFMLNIQGAGYCYSGFIIDKDDKIVKEIGEITKDE